MDCGFAVVHLRKVALWRLLECGGGKEGCCYLKYQGEDLQVNHSEATFTFSFQTLDGDFGKRSCINDRLGVFAACLHIPSY